MPLGLVTKVCHGVHCIPCTWGAPDASCLSKVYFASQRLLLYCASGHWTLPQHSHSLSTALSSVSSCPSLLPTVCAPASCGEEPCGSAGQEQGDVRTVVALLHHHLAACQPLAPSGMPLHSCCNLSFIRPVAFWSGTRLFCQCMYLLYCYLSMWSPSTVLLLLLLQLPVSVSDTAKKPTALHVSSLSQRPARLCTGFMFSWLPPFCFMHVTSSCIAVDWTRLCLSGLLCVIEH